MSPGASLGGPGGPPADPYPPPGAVAEAVRRALAEDLYPLGDLTAALVPAEREATLAIRARAHGVLAGELCARETFAQVDPSVKVRWLLPDGTRLAPGDVVATVRGPLRPILTAERTALNFLGHLSGVASLTRRYVEVVAAANPEARVLDTRKTTPGLRALEKAAVRAGGGRNHRGSLSEAVLVKDNHLEGTTIAGAVARARALWPGRWVEVECDRADQVAEACRCQVDAVLLDNMTPEQAAACVELVHGSSAGRVPLVEVSGGLTLETVGAYAAAGCDLLSVGALTHSVPVLDLGLDALAELAPGGPRPPDAPDRPKEA